MGCVSTEVDYPPTANAGTQTVVYMPKNEVTLNGNLSTDDKGIKAWEWTKSPDTDKHVDMEVGLLLLLLPSFFFWQMCIYKLGSVLVLDEGICAFFSVYRFPAVHRRKMTK